MSLKDVLATVYHLLGVDPETHLRDREGRPSALVPNGEIVRTTNIASNYHGHPPSAL